MILNNCGKLQISAPSSMLEVSDGMENACIVALYIVYILFLQLSKNEATATEEK